MVGSVLRVGLFFILMLSPLALSLTLAALYGGVLMALGITLIPGVPWLLMMYSLTRVAADGIESRRINSQLFANYLMTYSHASNPSSQAQA